MKGRIVLSCVLVALAMVVLLFIEPAPAEGMGPTGPTGPSALRASAGALVPDLASLLAYPYPVQIRELAGVERDHVVDHLMQTPEAVHLRLALMDKGFMVALPDAVAMKVTVGEEGGTRTIDVVVAPAAVGRWLFLPLVVRGFSGDAFGGAGRLVPSVRSGSAPGSPSAEGLVAYLTAMVADDGSSFFQAHHTNLDPGLAEVPDPALIVNGVPYFYITTLQVVSDRLVHWHYWWYDSHHHPDWYYSLYRHYWDYTDLRGYSWPGWYHWVYGWYYWRFWYYWSTWFPY
jgi:hypothetical protein